MYNKEKGISKVGDGMEQDSRVSAVALFYMCDKELAKVIIKSAEENGTQADIDRIVREIQKS